MVEAVWDVLELNALKLEIWYYVTYRLINLIHALFNMSLENTHSVTARLVYQKVGWQAPMPGQEKGHIYRIFSPSVASLRTGTHP